MRRIFISFNKNLLDAFISKLLTFLNKILQKSQIAQHTKDD